MLRLFLLRHGKATNYQDSNTDFQRHLNKKGTAQVNQIGYILSHSNFAITQIISSGAVRTTETAEIINYFLKLPKIEFDDQLFLADAKKILAKLESCGKHENLLYVGHNNGISDLANYLTGTPVTMSTSELLIISFPIDSWQLISGSTGVLEQKITPYVHSF